MNLLTWRVYNHIGYDVTDYFRLASTAVTEVQRRSKIAAYDGFAAAYLANRLSKIRKFHRHINDDLPYICTGFDVTNSFRSEATSKKQSKMPPQTALVRILVARRFASPPIGGLLVTGCKVDVHQLLLYSIHIDLLVFQFMVVAELSSQLVAISHPPRKVR